MWKQLISLTAFYSE